MTRLNILKCSAYVLLQVLTVLQMGLHTGMTMEQVCVLVVSSLIAGLGALLGFLQDPSKLTAISPSKPDSAQVSAAPQKPV